MDSGIALIITSATKWSYPRRYIILHELGKFLNSSRDSRIVDVREYVHEIRKLVRRSRTIPTPVSQTRLSLEDVSSQKLGDIFPDPLLG
jgi:hypothetical protein